MTFDEIEKTTADINLALRTKEAKKEAEAPSFGEVALAAANTNIVGFNKFTNMVENKHMMYTNEGDDDYSKSEEFKKKTKGMAVEDIIELSDAKNPMYLDQMIANNKRYKRDLNIIEESGATGMAAEVVSSLLDPVSWVVGGAVLKPFKVAETAFAVQGKALTAMRAVEGSVIVATASGTAEALIQDAAGVNDQERLDTIIGYSAVLGAALPLVIPAIGGLKNTKAVASVSKAMANGTADMGWTKHFAVSTGEQLRVKGTSDFSRKIGDDADTPARAYQDSEGNFIVKDTDTAMDVRRDLTDNSINMLEKNISIKAKANGRSNQDQAHVDGTLYNKAANEIEQEVRADIGKMTQEDKLVAYKEATGTDVLPAEAKKSQTDNKITKTLEDLEISKRRLQTTIDNDIAKESTQALRKLESSRETKLKLAQGRLASEEEAILKANAKDEVFINQKHLKSVEPKVEARRQDIITRNKQLAKLKGKVDELSAPSVLKPEVVEGITKRANTKNKPIINRLEKSQQKQQGAIEKSYKGKFDEPEDLLSVLQNHMRTKGFDSGKYRMPKDLDYVSDFYGGFGKAATEVELGGIAGKDSRGFGHVKYNHQEILRDVPKAEANFEEMLKADNLNKQLMKEGKLTEEEIKKIAKHMVDLALDNDLTNRYLSKGNAGATSATRQRKLRMDRSLYPEMFVNDIGVIATEYADNIGGKIAMKKVYGLQADSSGSIHNNLEATYRKVAEEGRANGASEGAIKRDVENVKAIFETVLGTRKFSKAGGANTVARLGKKASNALYSAGFVKYGLVEPWVAVARFGLTDTVKNFIPAFGRMKEHLGTIDPKDPLVKLMNHTGTAGQTLRGIRYDRYDNNEIAPTSGKTEMFLDQASHYSRKYSGFNYVNDISDFIAGGSAMNALFRVGTKGSMTRQEASQFARFNLSLEDTIAIAKNKDILRKADGSIEDYNLENWSNQDLAKKTKRYLQRSVTDTIMRSDGTRVHRWQSDVNNPFLNMGLQYTQMPTVLYERLIYNGMDEAGARTAVGVIGSIVSMYMILDLENTVAKAAGGEGETEEEILTKAITRIPFVGILPNVMDYALILAGQENTGGFKGRDVSQFGGASMGVANKVLRALQGLGDGADSKDVANFLKVLPIINAIPLVGTAFKTASEGLKE